MSQTATLKPTLCLNMIVKNESKIIERLLESVLPIIDTYCICDTGSTDNTKEIISDFFNKHNISGKIVSEPFKDFAYNRNFALNSCSGMSDYVLLLDADMILQIKNFNKNILNDYDFFHILQGNDAFYYANTRIVKNNGSFNYIGVTHEYVNYPGHSKLKLLDKNEIFILDIGDGGAKSDKFERDVRLLTKGIEEEPNNRTRYYFYLANSYFDLGQYENAIENYKKRIECGGWPQEVWFSNFKIGHCYKNMDKMEQAIYYWLECFNIIPERLENFYEIIQYYKNCCKNKLALQFYNLAKEYLVKEFYREDYLFLHKDVYSYKLFFEYTIIAYYLGIKNINYEVVQVLNNSLDNNCVWNLLINMKYYKDILHVRHTTICDDNLIERIDGDDVEFRSSSSCLIPKKDGGYIMNIRYVNYLINDQGWYIHSKNGKVITKNKYVELNEKIDVILSKNFDLNYNNKMYIGVEDIKIFQDVESNDILFIGTGQHDDGSIGVVYGKYNIENPILKPIEIKQKFKQTECEKNWVFVDYKESTHIIYSWNPFLICKINKETNYLDIIDKKEMPNMFKHVRGSTCGFKYNNEIWFVTHIVSYEYPRHYYHVLVVMDENLNLLRYSAPFKFQGEPIEYCLSLLVEEERVLINYSVWDRTTRINYYDKKYIESKLIYKP